MLGMDQKRVTTDLYVITNARTLRHLRSHQGRNTMCKRHPDREELLPPGRSTALLCCNKLGNVERGKKKDQSAKKRTHNRLQRNNWKGKNRGQNAIPSHSYPVAPPPPRKFCGLLFRTFRFSYCGGTYQFDLLVSPLQIGLDYDIF